MELLELQLTKLIEAIYQEADHLFQNQLKSTALGRSFKKTTISEIDFTNEIYKYILWYRSELSSSLNSFAHEVSLLSTENFDVSYRVKASNSIIYKIQRYKKIGSCEDDYGKFPLTKVLNDIAGFRVIMLKPPKTIELAEYINEVYQTKIRVINSDKDEYRAIHLYTSINNKMLPWEIQIWDAENEINNIISHSNYKQEYIKWEAQQSDLEF